MSQQDWKSHILGTMCLILSGRSEKQASWCTTRPRPQRQADTHCPSSSTTRKKKREKNCWRARRRQVCSWLSGHKGALLFPSDIIHFSLISFSAALSPCSRAVPLCHVSNCPVLLKTTSCTPSVDTSPFPILVFPFPPSWSAVHPVCQLREPLALFLSFKATMIHPS